MEILDWYDLVGEKLEISFLITPWFERKERNEWRGMIERWKEEKNEKGGWEMKGVCCGEEEEGWEGESCGLVCGWEKKRETRGGGGNSWRMREKEWENNKTINFFQILNYQREFHKIHINRGRERIVQPLKGCVSSRGATFWGDISTLLKGCLKKPLVKMWGCHLEGFNW